MMSHIDVGSTPNITRRVLRECGLYYFRQDLKEGETVSFKSTFDDINVGGHNVILASGKLKFVHPDKTPEETILEPSKTLLFHGLTIPGEYTLTALEDSTYVCCTHLAFMPNLPIGLGTKMYKVEHKHMEFNESLSLSEFPDVKCVMAMTGSFQLTSDGTICKFGSKVDVTPETNIVALEPAHLMIISN